MLISIWVILIIYLIFIIYTVAELLYKNGIYSLFDTKIPYILVGPLYAFHIPIIMITSPFILGEILVKTVS